MVALEEEARRVTLATLAEIAQTGVDTIRGGQRLREDLGMDSLQSLELLSTIGEALKIDLDIEEAMGIQTVDDACAFVTRKYKEQKADGGPVRG
jgi:acyl carrier protein